MREEYEGHILQLKHELSQTKTTLEVKEEESFGYKAQVQRLESEIAVFQESATSQSSNSASLAVMVTTKDQEIQDLTERLKLHE